MITAVLPVTTKDLDRTEILFHSLAKFFAPDDLSHVLVLVPDRQFDEISARIAPCGLRHQIVRETEICSDVSGVGGWYVQQLAKLGAWKLVNTPFYLTLDADVICTRPTRYNDLVRDGLGRQHREARSIHPEWWTRSAKLLNVRPALKSEGMGVTPLLYSAEGTRQLTAELDRLHGDWLVALKSSNLWAEHCLYDLYLEKTEQWGKFHFAAPFYAHCVWHRHEFDAWPVADVFSQSSQTHFTVCQSNTEIPLADVWAKVGPYLR